jgi:hypothetical protein
MKTFYVYQQRHSVYQISFINPKYCLSIDTSIKTPSPTNLLSRVSSPIKEKSSEYSKMTGEFRYCATCGRSIGVRLYPCKRCQKTSFCSKACKIDGWNQFHRFECRQSPSPAERPSMNLSENKFKEK